MSCSFSNAHLSVPYLVSFHSWQRLSAVCFTIPVDSPVRSSKSGVSLADLGSLGGFSLLLRIVWDRVVRVDKTRDWDYLDLISRLPPPFPLLYVSTAFYRQYRSSSLLLLFLSSIGPSTSREREERESLCANCSLVGNGAVTRRKKLNYWTKEGDWWLCPLRKKEGNPPFFVCVCQSVYDISMTI